jgi:hypothetical protein
MRDVKRWLKKLVASSLGLILLSMIFTQNASAMLVTYGGDGGSSAGVITKFNGAYNTLNSPPSPVVAVNANEVLQLNNNQFRITNKSGTTIGGGSASALNHSGEVYLTDPQVMWDPSTSRFYYSYEENNEQPGGSVANDGIGWGFSTTANPTSAASFCSYFNAFNYGANFNPERQSLGDTSSDLIWSSLRLQNSNGYEVGSDAAWVNKPPVGSTCPSGSYFTSGIQSLSNAIVSNPPIQWLSYPYDPVAAKEVDNSSTSWIVGLPTVASANYLTLISVSTGSNGTPVFGAPRNVPVPAYTHPPAGVPQAGTSVENPSQAAPELTTVIDLNGMYMAYDPDYGSNALWTSHTISNGRGGTNVRWYEINPATSSLDQSGTIGNSSLDFFNSAVAPDRAVTGSRSAFGSDMVITFSSSSASTYPAMWYQAKAGFSVAFAPQKILSSPAHYDDFTCYWGTASSPIPCRFGDWPGAAPDPSASNGGRVWVSNEWNVAQTSTLGYSIWRTEIAEIGVY